MTDGMTDGVTDARDRLVLALDVGGLDEALALAERLRPWFSTAKVGYELYAEAGPAVFDRLHELDLRVFADLKLHDIPTTVARGARVLGRRGVDFLNFHAAGGVDMLRAGADAARDGARDAGVPEPIVLAVTVLTSDANTAEMVPRLVAARDAGCDGVVCAATDVAAARTHELRTMVPGIRPAGASTHDQQRVATPGGAIALGAEWIILGRGVTAADDPEACAADVTDEVVETLHAR
jgi:orotidine-5'-phosphate decarboxylase